MAVAHDQSATVNFNGANSANVTLSTAGTNRYIDIFSDVSNDTATISSITATGLTFVKIHEISKGTNNGWISRWRAFASTQLSSLVITVNYTGGFPQGSVVASSYSGTDLTGTNGSGAVGATNSTTGLNNLTPSLAITTTRANSLVTGGFGQDSASAWTAGASQTINAQTASAGGFSTAAIERQNSVTGSSGSSVSMSASTTSNNAFGLSVVELLAPSVGSIVFPSRLNRNTLLRR